MINVNITPTFKEQIMTNMEMVPELSKFIATPYWEHTVLRVMEGTGNISEIITWVTPSGNIVFECSFKNHDINIDRQYQIEKTIKDNILKSDIDTDLGTMEISEIDFTWLT